MDSILFTIIDKPLLLYQKKRDFASRNIEKSPENEKKLTFYQIFFKIVLTNEAKIKYNQFCIPFCKGNFGLFIFDKEV